MVGRPGTMPKIALTFDLAEVYGDGPAAQAIEDLFAGMRSKEDVAFNVLKVDPVGLSSWLAAPVLAAIERKGTATAEVLRDQPVEPESAP